MDEEKHLWKWYEAGQWYGKFLLARFPDHIEALERLLQVTHWDLDEVRFLRREGVVLIRCISKSLSLEETEFVCYFLEGVMHSLGYKTKEKDATRGIILLTFDQGGALSTGAEM
jgi:hypothetical protein